MNKEELKDKAIRMGLPLLPLDKEEIINMNFSDNRNPMIGICKKCGNILRQIEYQMCPEKDCQVFKK